ncbi:4'-phosphopantetheinyl transferase superfamily protein [Chamaesiphon sp. VAR_69_metabat_338]|uniref:4'-phosphopantetheinyl transferase family protein n=1 Tax=Chamaesiphon sp. VAR_69_metabat_338 TaxID=2964704 RepID=UPI00286DE5A6|nr:4'-phosphopantetheinyl transferase superfamily protein [Chamaesiphon sp. VAR_69_metabat_338]
MLLPPREIQIWSTNLDRERAQIDKFSQLLTATERQRAAKFVNPLHGDRWIVARGYLRQILSQYLDLSPAQIEFSYGAQGKPEIAGSQLQFNLSHSHDRAVYGISAQHPIGIDIEYIHPIAAADLVDRFFSTAEQAIFHNLSIDLHQAAFFHAWVQKEAYLKACGTGLHTPLDKIEVSIDPRTPAAIMAAPIAGTWRIQKLEIAADFASAMAIGGDYDNIRYLQ